MRKVQEKSKKINKKTIRQVKNGAVTSVNLSPSSRQLKKYKIFPASRLAAGSFLCGLQVDFMFFHRS